MIKGDCSLDLLTYSIQIAIINLMVQIARNCHPESLVAFQFSDINHEGDLDISSGIECKFTFYHHVPLLANIRGGKLCLTYKHGRQT